MNTCCICLDNLDNDYKPYQCNHYIHYKCFQSWSNKCPLCLSKPKYNSNKIKYYIKNKKKYLQRPILNTKYSEFGNNYEKIQFNCGNWYDVKKGNYFEILFKNGWKIVSKDFLNELNRL
jgi:hypothetical protein